MENTKIKSGDRKLPSEKQYRGAGKNLKRPGVYTITHTPSGRRYIGGSLDCVGRFTFHRWSLRRGTHSCKALQALWSAGAEHDFEFSIQEHCAHDKGVIRQVEQRWLDAEPEAQLLNQERRWQGSSATPSDARKQAAKKLWERPGYRSDFINSRNTDGTFVARSRA